MEISRISIFMSKNGRGFEDLKNRDNFKEHKGIIKERRFKVNNHECILYYMNKNIKHNKNPDWLDFINQMLSDKDKIEAVQKSIRPSGLLLIKIKDRIFGSCFGTSGTSLIDKKNFEKDFGIKVAMNSCNTEEISQTKSSIRSYHSQLIYRVNSIPGEQNEFGLSEMEFLDYLSANLDGRKGISIHGKDNLIIKTDSENKFNWDKFIIMLKDFFRDYDSDDYKRRFPNYAILEPVKQEKEEVLDKILTDKIRSNKFDKLHLSVPEIIDEEKYTFIYGNAFKKSTRRHAFIESEHLTIKKKNSAIFNNEKQINIDFIKSHRVNCYDEEHNLIDRNKSWYLYDCIVCEEYCNPPIKL